jgi:polygalacturonase
MVLFHLFIPSYPRTIGNTDGIDISSSRDAVIENVMIKNSDDGICMNSGARGPRW